MTLVIVDAKNAPLMAKHYKNWLSVGLSHYLRKKTIPVVLKDSNITLPEYSKVPLEHLAILLEAGWRAMDIDDTYLTLQSPQGYKIKTRLREMSDILALVEVFKDEVYKNDLDGKVVVDVGMYIADSSIYFVAKGAKKVIGIEAFEDNYNVAKENVSINAFDDRITLINAAVSDKEGQALLDVSDLLHSSRLLPLSEKREGTILVKTWSINKIIQDNNLDVIDLMKIDCEGCEYDLFRTLDERILPKIDSFMIEYHDGSEIIEKYLAAHGFHVTIKGNKMKGHLHAVRK